MLTNGHFRFSRMWLLPSKTYNGHDNNPSLHFSLFNPKILIIVTLSYFNFHALNEYKLSLFGKRPLCWVSWLANYDLLSTLSWNREIFRRIKSRLTHFLHASVAPHCSMSAYNLTQPGSPRSFLVSLVVALASDRRAQTTVTVMDSDNPAIVSKNFSPKRLSFLHFSFPGKKTHWGEMWRNPSFCK